MSPVDQLSTQHEPEPSPQTETDGPSRLPGWLTETPYWAVSGVVHLVLILAIGSLVLLEADSSQPVTATQIRFTQKRTPPPPRPEYQPHVTDNDSTFEPVNDTKTVIEPKPPAIESKGKPKNQSHVDTPVDEAAEIFQGLGPGGGSPHGDRGTRGVPSNAAATEDVVLRALWWLVKHQNEDGSWSANLYNNCCVEGEPCTMKRTELGTGQGFAGFDVGVTGLAMLAFLGYGHTHRDGEHVEFRQAMRKALSWMKKQQVRGGPESERGRLGAAHPEEWIYNHAIGTMALAETLFWSRDFRLKKCVEEAAQFCLAFQNPGYGWKYGYRPGPNDTSVTGWMVLALKTVRSCVVTKQARVDRDKIDEHLGWALRWFELATSPVTGKTGYESRGDEGSRLLKAYPEPYPFSKQLSCMTAVSLLCRLLAGESRRSKPIKRAVQVLTKELPEWKYARSKSRSKINMYHWYYATYALFQAGGPAWRKWNKALVPTLCQSQRQSGCEHGSWDPVGEWGAAGGRVYATAINAMTLQVYYRFERVQETAPQHVSTKK